MRFRLSLLALAGLHVIGSQLYARQPVHAEHGMVAAQETHAADVGVAVLKAGGNAVDAAVAVGFALAVTHPYAGNIGGGGFMLIRMVDGRTTFLDFRECAPGSASHDMYLDRNGKLTHDSLIGWRASGVPGTVRGMDLALRKFGTKKWAEVLQPAVDLASHGFRVSYGFAELLKSSRELLGKFEASKHIFLKGGSLYEAGDTLVQPELAATLERIRDHGEKEFYEGETAQMLAKAMQEHGGTITLDDLKNYKVAERTPLRGHYRDYEILTAPPPSSGGVGVLQMLAMLEGSGYEKSGAGSAAAIHYVAEVERRFYADRSEFLADPGFYHVPIAQLLDPVYIRSRRESIDLNHATPSSHVGPGHLGNLPHESSETTHYNVVDKDGNAVAVTYTLNGGYGSGVTVPGAGFLLNNEMDDFSAKPGVPNMFGLVQGEANAIQPGKRPLSSMTPTIVVRSGKPYLVIGAPGGSRIINGVFEVMLNVFDFGMNVQDAIDWPRFHQQWKPDILYVEHGTSPDTKAILKRMGYQLEGIGGVARVEAILIDGGWLQGGTDGRASDGKAAGF